MGLQGTLTKQNLGFSMPIGCAPLPEAALHLQGREHDGLPVTSPMDRRRPGSLPEQAELADPPTAGLVFATYPESTLGPYSEVVLFLNAVYKEKERQIWRPPLCDHRRGDGGRS